MEQYRVFVTRKIPQEGLAMLQRFCDVGVSDFEDIIPQKVLPEKVGNRHGIFTLLTDTIDREVMESAGESLRVISRYATSFDDIDVTGGIIVTNTPGVLTETTADLAWALLMSVARRTVESDAFVRAGKFTGWNSLLLLGRMFMGKVLGIVGFGRIGKAMTRRPRGFAMEIWYYDRERTVEEEEREWGVRYAASPELLQRVDSVTPHISLNASTYHSLERRNCG